MQHSLDSLVYVTLFVDYDYEDKDDVTYGADPTTCTWTFITVK